MAEQARAWCQSCSTVAGGLECRQTCYACDGANDVLLRWRRPCLDFVLHEAGSADIPHADVLQILNRSFDRWTGIQCDGQPVGLMAQARVDVSTCDRPEFNQDKGNANTIVFVDDWQARGHAPGAFALTTTWFSRSSGEIYDADMELNQERWTFGVCPERGCSDDTVDLENTVVHELGHFFGLAHSDTDAETTMWACAEEGEVLKRDLEADDRLGLCSIYPPGSLRASCEYEPTGGFDPMCGREQPESCGCSAPGTPRRAPWLVLIGVAILYATRRSKSQ